MCFLRNHSESEIKWMCDLLWLTNVKRFLILQDLKYRFIFNLKYLSPPMAVRMRTLTCSSSTTFCCTLLYSILPSLTLLCYFSLNISIFSVFQRSDYLGISLFLYDWQIAQKNQRRKIRCIARRLSLVMNTLSSFVLLPERPEGPLHTLFMLL